MRFAFFLASMCMCSPLWALPTRIDEARHNLRAVQISAHLKNQRVLQHDVVIPAFAKDDLANDAYDHRGNVVVYTQLETVWAVDALQSGTQPLSQTTLDMIPAWWQGSGDKELKTGNDIVARHLELMAQIGLDTSSINVKGRNEYGPDGLGRFVQGQISFAYKQASGVWAHPAASDAKHLLAPPGGGFQEMDVRDTNLRNSPSFEGGEEGASGEREGKGREKLTDAINVEQMAQGKKSLKRQMSLQNNVAGICQVENTPDEAKGFFPEEVVHAKNLYRASYVKGKNSIDVATQFADAGAPFIAGGSGSLATILFTMEETCAGDEEILKDETESMKDEDDSLCPDLKMVFPKGLVPAGTGLRDLLIGLEGAALVAGGHHSISELILAAQGLGYLSAIPMPMESYPEAMKAFMEGMAQIGVGGEKYKSVTITPSSEI